MAMTDSVMMFITDLIIKQKIVTTATTIAFSIFHHRPRLNITQNSTHLSFRMSSSPVNNDKILIKQRLRKTIRSKLRSLSSEEVEKQSLQVWMKLFETQEYKESKSVGLFLSMPQHEIKTDQACNQVLQDGKTLYIPRVGLDFEKCNMELVKVDQDFNVLNKDNKMFYNQWPRNKWGIPEPPVSESTGDDVNDDPLIARPGDIDLLIVPGLAFDKFGARLGQGKGYYDRFITKMKHNNYNRTSPLLVAVGLEPSFVDVDGSDNCDGIPMSDHDFYMDRIIVPHLDILNVTK